MESSTLTLQVVCFDAFPFVFFKIFEHVRGSGTVDKIKKYRRDSTSGAFTDLGRRDLTQPPASVNPDGRGR